MPVEQTVDGCLRANNNFIRNHITRAACIMSELSRVFVTTWKLADVPVESRYSSQRNEVSKTANDLCVPIPAITRGTSARSTLNYVHYRSLVALFHTEAREPTARRLASGKC